MDLVNAVYLCTKEYIWASNIGKLHWGKVYERDEVSMSSGKRVLNEPYCVKY